MLANDWLEGGDGRFDDMSYDTSLGGSGDDIIYNENPDPIDGGAGDDLAIIVRRDSDIAIKADFADLNKTQVLADGAVFSEIKRVDFFGGSGVDFVRAGNGAVQLRGGGGADQLWGGAASTC